MKQKQIGFTYEQVQEAMTSLARAESSLKKLTAEQDMKLNQVREKNAERMAELLAEMENCKALLTIYANEHKEEWPTRKLELTNGTLKFTTGTGKVVLPEGTTEDDLVEMLEKKNHYGFIATTSCISKQAVLDFGDTPEGKKVLKLTGITIEKSDKLSIKTKTEKLLPA